MDRFAHQDILSSRVESLGIKASASEVQRQIGFVWRNVLRIMTWAGPGAHFDGHDQTPTHSRISDGKMVVGAGKKK